MEPWLFFAIASLFVGGLYSFLLKVAAVRNYDASLLSIYSYVVVSILAFGYLIYEGMNISNFMLTAIFATVHVIFYFISVLTRIESMKNIDSILFFPIYKTFGPLAITAVSVSYFGESLTLKEIIGIVIGISIPLLLISANEKMRQINLKRGILFLLFTVILSIITTTISKEIQNQNLNIPFFIFLTSFIGIIVSYIKYRYIGVKKNGVKNSTQGLLSFGIWLGILHFLSYYTFISALSGNLAVVYTIDSFGILIPIILSIIFYKDHFDLKKAIVIALSIVSILLFL